MDIYDDVEDFVTPQGVGEMIYDAEEADERKVQAFVAANQAMLKRLMEVRVVRSARQSHAGFCVDLQTVVTHVAVYRNHKVCRCFSNFKDVSSAQ